MSRPPRPSLSGPPRSDIALAWIDGLIRAGEVADLVAVARMCGVSSARVSKVVGLLGMAPAPMEHLIVPSRPSSCGHLSYPAERNTS